MIRTLFFFFFLFYSCHNNDRVVFYPNESSEMARLMRNMVNQLEDVKSKVKNNEDLYLMKLEFPLIHKSQPTDKMHIDSDLEWMSKSFDSVVNIYNTYPSIKSYNNIIQSCMNCHISYCNGPMGIINTLYFNKK